MRLGCENRQLSRPHHTNCFNEAEAHAPRMPIPIYQFTRPEFQLQCGRGACASDARLPCEIEDKPNSKLQ